MNVLDKLNMEAGKKTFFEALEHYQKHKKHIEYLAGHYIVMANAYDYACHYLTHKTPQHWAYFMKDARGLYTKQSDAAKTLALQKFIETY